QFFQRHELVGAGQLDPHLAFFGRDDDLFAVGRFRATGDRALGFLFRLRGRRRVHGPGVDGRFAFVARFVGAADGEGVGAGGEAGEGPRRGARRERRVVEAAFEAVGFAARPGFAELEG